MEGTAHETLRCPPVTYPKGWMTLEQWIAGVVDYVVCDVLGSFGFADAGADVVRDVTKKLNTAVVGVLGAPFVFAVDLPCCG